ncbi:hypothetical protein BDB00DRAFT_805686 [Zychaea mexicana]|nr:uncharacterized protein BDB00DRAFT_805686 [Zychaea mexicana]KAI9497254.1 hypothetical protein BDB00DRAFT_805686 [Zychaea mexicana]
MKHDPSAEFDSIFGVFAGFLFLFFLSLYYHYTATPFRHSAVCIWKLYSFFHNWKIMNAGQLNPDLHQQATMRMPEPSSSSSSSSKKQQPGKNKPFDEDDNDSADDSDSEKPSKRSGRRKIKIEYIEDKNRRHITFSKRKAGIMKKAYELSTLTGTQVLLLVVSETGLVYTFTTVKLQPIVTKPEGKNLIQACLNAPDPVPNESSSDATYTKSEASRPVEKKEYDDKKIDTSAGHPAAAAFGAAAAAAAAAASHGGSSATGAYQPAAYAPTPGNGGQMPSGSNGYPSYMTTQAAAQYQQHQQHQQHQQQHQQQQQQPQQQQGQPQQGQPQQQYGQMPAPPFYGAQQTHHYMPQHANYWQNSPSNMPRQEQGHGADDKARGAAGGPGGMPKK